MSIREFALWQTFKYTHKSIFKVHALLKFIFKVHALLKYGYKVHALEVAYLVIYLVKLRS